MCRRSRVSLWLDVFAFFGFALLPGLGVLCIFCGLGILSETTISDSFKALQIVQSPVFSFFLMLVALMFLEVFIAFLQVGGIRNYICQQVIGMASFHKDSDKSCREKVSEYLDHVNKLVELVLWPLHDLFTALIVVLLSAVFVWSYCPDVFAVSYSVLLTGVIFLWEVLLCRYEKSSCLPDSSNTNLKPSGNERIKFTLRKSMRKFFIEYSDITDKVISVLTPIFLVAYEVLPQKFLPVVIVFSGCFSKGSRKAGKIFCTFPKMKKCIENIRIITGDNESRSESEWRYLYQLLTATGRFRP